MSRLEAALAALRAGRLPEAERLYRQILRATPEDADALHGLGIVQLALKQPGRALGFFERALRVTRASSQVFNNHATALNALGRPEEALFSLESALALAPQDAGLHYNVGNTLMALWRHADALAAFARAVGLAPGMAQAWRNRAVVETRLALHEAALASCDRVIALTPGAAAAHEARGEALLALARPAEAIAAFEAASALAPSLAIAHLNKAHALNVTGRVEEAMVAVDAALREDPDLALAHFNAGCMCLARGDFARGWREFEWRWRKDDFRQYLRNFAQPLWLGGTDIGGKTILLHAEQGFGDTIQFCRYAAMVAALGARVVLEVQRPLLELMRTLPGPDLVIARDDGLPEFDLHCPLMSLPLAFGTEAASIPWSGAYLAADPAKVDSWRRRLGVSGKPIVGLAWSGARGFGGDAYRSAPLDSWARMIRPEYAYVCLQKDVREADAVAARAIGVRLLQDEITDFADVAALTALMDVVISVDSAPAHLAGAMGGPVWVMLPEHAEWRWRQSGKRSPWYPGALLFRQATPGWDTLAGEVGDALQAHHHRMSHQKNAPHQEREG